MAIFCLSRQRKKRKYALVMRRSRRDLSANLSWSKPVVATRSARTMLIGAAMAILMLSVARPGWAMLRERRTPDYVIKANYLYKFVPFVEWPPRAFAGTHAPLVICIVGDDPFGVALDDAVRHRLVNGRPIVVRRMSMITHGTPCHILFVGHSDDQAADDIWRAIAGEPILTVTDYAPGVAGGIIQFVLYDGRVRFMIDAPKAQASGLLISSKLLDLAVRMQP